VTLPTTKIANEFDDDDDDDDDEWKI